MVVFICEDVIKALDKVEHVNHEHARRIFDELSLAALRGKHFVLIENFLNARIQKIIKRYTADNSFLCLSKSNTAQALAILEIVNLVMIVSFHKINGNSLKKRYNNQKLLPLDPSKDTGIELNVETHLITENQRDMKLFEAITRRYLKKLKMSKQLDLRIYNISGGGFTISEAYDQEKNLGAHLCITIVDSDKKYPDGEEGATATELRTHIDDGWKFSDHHIMSDLSEIENLLPVSLYENKSNKPLIKLLSKFDLSFYDLKCGLTAESLKNEACYAHWSKIGIGLPSIADIRVQPDNKQIVKGIGNQAIPNFLKRKNYQGDIMGIKNEDLSTGQKKEYSAISNLIFNWCVCSTPARL